MDFSWGEIHCKKLVMWGASLYEVFTSLCNFSGVNSDLCWVWLPRPYRCSLLAVAEHQVRIPGWSPFSACEHMYLKHLIKLETQVQLYLHPKLDITPITS